MSSQADNLARAKSMELIQKSMREILEQINRGEKPTLIIPKRTLSNTIYDIDNKILLLGPEVQYRSFIDVKEAKKFMQTLLMASIIFDALRNNEYPTIRDLYYRGKHTISYRSIDGKRVSENTWDEQRESDSVMRDLEVYLSILREDLLILSKEKGKVVGNLVLRSGDDLIDLSKMGHGAYAIEPTPDLIEFIDIDAEYVLIVEKDAVFQQLHRYGFWRKHRAILITSAGQPDRATRRFARRLSDEYRLPVYILTDSDPYGFYIYSVFKAGSITLSYESERLAVPSARFIGVMMTDIFGDDPFKKLINEREIRKTLEEITPRITDLRRKTPYLSESERSNFLIKAKNRDVERAVELIGYRVADVCIGDRDVKNRIKRKEGITGYPWFTTPEWVREICIFFNTLSKLEIEAFASKGLRFLVDKYIPEKISTGDWID